jgi:hypothetical protein
MKRKKTQEENTPIIDGDARPDMPTSNEEIKKSTASKRSFTSNRKADIDKREDYKDAKQ